MARRGSLPRHGRTRSDLAGSEVIGTLLIFSLTVSLGAVVAVTSWNAVMVTAPAPTAAFDVAIHEGRATVTRVGGDAVELADVRIEWVVDGTEVADPGGRSGAWALGEALNLTHANVTGTSRVDVRVFHVPSKSILASLSKQASGATAAPATGGPSFPDLTQRALLADGVSSRALVLNVTHPSGLAFIKHVAVNLTGLGGAREHALKDDGRNGDARAGDGRFSSDITLAPFDVAGLYDYDLWVTAWDIEGRNRSALLPVRVEVAIPQVQTVYQNFTIEPCKTDCKVAGKVSTGTSLSGVPSSADIVTMRVSNITWDKDAGGKTGNVITLRVIDGNGTVWTAIIGLDGVAGAPPTVKSLEIKYYNLWTTATTSSTTCTPLGAATGVAYTRDMTIDLLNPTAPERTTDITWSCGSTTAGHYKLAGIAEGAVLTVAKIGHPTNEGNTVIVNADIAYG